MKRHGLILFMVALLILPVFAMTLNSCAKKEVKKQVGLTDEEKARLEAERRAREEAERRRLEELRRLEAEKARIAALRDSFLNDHALFDFDKYNIRPDAEVVLREKADFMMAVPSVVTEVQGHCDARGTEAYNMVLGQHRANSAMSFLESLGISASRMKPVSYGESMPLVGPCSTESCWQQNRRAQFIILAE